MPIVQLAPVSQEMAMNLSSPRAPATFLAARLRVSPARRRLFDVSDAEIAENQSLVRRELDSIQKQDSLHWNFNFELEKPCDGRFQWTAVAALNNDAADVPSVDNAAHCFADQRPTTVNANGKRTIDCHDDAEQQDNSFAIIRKMDNDVWTFKKKCINNRPTTIGQTKITGKQFYKLFPNFEACFV